MLQTVPDFSSAMITILFLLALGIAAYFIKKKSGPLKKIIKSHDNLEVLNQLSLRDGYLAYLLKVGNDNFFFVAHKSGRGSLTQVNNLSDSGSKINKNKIETIPSSKVNQLDKSLINNTENKKPLQHVNISDLLTAHKKGNKDA